MKIPKKKETYENLDLPLPKFFDFLFHKLYFKCFGHSSKQALIGSCNDIVGNTLQQKTFCTIN